jgi:hydroxyacylglutathione hydrolase
MIFRQFIHEDLGCASYLIGDQQAGVAAVVDPKFEIDGYLSTAAYMGVSIEHVLETHNHADHLSGHGRLAAATGATIHIHRDATPAYEHEPFDDGWELELGDLLIRALHTPGHRPEHTAYVLTDRARGPREWALLSGDSLFVGDIARPDLAIEKEAGARTIFRSLHERLLRLPDDCELWPGHLGGSMCGGPLMDLKVSSTIGFERASNPALAIADEQQFVNEILETLGPQPPNFQSIVALNKGPLLSGEVGILPLTARQVEEKRRAGVLLIDVRTDLQFDDAHIAGSVCIPMMRAGFGSKLAWLADHGQEIALLGRDDEDGRVAGRLAVAVGISKIGGFLHGGMTNWRQDKRSVEHTKRLELSRLADLREADPDMQILDVREQSEWDAGHIPGSIFTAWHDIAEIPDGIDPARPVAVVCGSGQRAATAASLVQRHGAREVIHVVDGGVPKWGQLGHPLEQTP